MAEFALDNEIHKDNYPQVRDLAGKGEIWEVRSEEMKCKKIQTGSYIITV